MVMQSPAGYVQVTRRSLQDRGVPAATLPYLRYAQALSLRTWQSGGTMASALLVSLGLLRQTTVTPIIPN